MPITSNNFLVFIETIIYYIKYWTIGDYPKMWSGFFLEYEHRHSSHCCGHAKKPRQLHIIAVWSYCYSHTATELWPARKKRNCTTHSSQSRSCERAKKLTQVYIVAVWCYCYSHTAPEIWPAQTKRICVAIALWTEQEFQQKNIEVRKYVLENRDGETDPTLPKNIL